MILNLETIKFNLELLKEVKEDYPILQDFEDGKVLYESVNNVGLDQFVSFIIFIRDLKRNSLDLVYDRKIDYKEVKNKIAEVSSDKARSIFSKKKQEDFVKIYNDPKYNKRYTRTRNQSYCSGLESCEPLILNFFAQNSIIFSDSFFRNTFYFRKLSKPKLYSRELKMTQQFINLFLDFTKQQDFDLRKCNIKSLVSEFQNRLRPLMKIQDGLQVKCIEEIKGFTVDKYYTVIESRITYYGFLEIKVADDSGVTNYHAYSSFEEVSRQRDDLFKQLGL